MTDEERAALIGQIRLLFDQLRKLGVRPEPINLHRLSGADLEAELDAVAEQLKTRKRFLGVN